MFKRFLLGGAVILSGPTAVLAADVVPAPLVYDWTGPYVGLNAGAAWNNSEFDHNDGTGIFAGFIADTIEGDQTVFTGGAQLGYNWQWDSMVVGVETDFNFLNFSTDETVLVGADSAHFEAKANWYGTTTAKLGYAVDNFLFYGDGGLAYGHSEAEGNVTVGGTTFSDDQSNVNWGWTLGAGVKYGINENWVVGAEYKYVNLGEADFDVNNGVGNAIRANTETAFSVVRATLDFRF
jgi:outer membrane immunogenic protein